MAESVPRPRQDEGRLLSRSYRIVNVGHGGYAFTDLRDTALGGVQNRQFRLFTPVKREWMRLPTSLPEFFALRHVANLSDSPLTVAAELGGHWNKHNLAAITHVAACNFRCSYCYVDFGHLSGADSFVATAAAVVDEFERVMRFVTVQSPTGRVPTHDVDGQWLNRTWRPQLTDLRLGWESYGEGSDTLWFDDVAVGPGRIGC
ncbi:hypothetical protein [Micromonospora sp. RTGN7]|uniref:hypothetical protein n=1 Tax=Micromonospora sp. RTGN7 TaxID=3016526 RepID=UPI0029FF4AEC|nr:hypothetical protein [Micromonospora sp. RTGN7]